MFFDCGDLGERWADEAVGRNLKGGVCHGEGIFTRLES
jgi:hypothetical protein